MVTFKVYLWWQVDHMIEYKDAGNNLGIAPNSQKL